jgi:SAM-dependent methyltransferase
MTCLRGECADVVVSFETIEHLADPGRFLGECRRLLRPGGLFICSTPNREVHRWSASNPFHVREFFPREFIRLLEQFFSECRVYGQGEVVFPLHISHVLLARFLEQIYVKERLKSFLRRPTPIAPETEFGKTARDCEYAIKPYRAGWFLKHSYLIVVAQKV